MDLAIVPSIGYSLKFNEMYLAAANAGSRVLGLNPFKAFANSTFRADAYSRKRSLWYVRGSGATWSVGKANENKDVRASNADGAMADIAMTDCRSSTLDATSDMAAPIAVDPIDDWAGCSVSAA
jgi:hypothetical protein